MSLREDFFRHYHVELKYEDDCTNITLDKTNNTEEDDTPISLTEIPFEPTTIINADSIKLEPTKPTKIYIHSEALLQTDLTCEIYNEKVDHAPSLKTTRYSVE